MEDKETEYLLLFQEFGLEDEYKERSYSYRDNSDSLSEFYF